MNNKVPVLTYHTVGNHKTKRPWSFLTVSVTVFENSMKYLKLKGYNTISLQELYEAKVNKTELPPKPIVLNFDDGFLDNWTIVYPILKKYGFKATVYVSPDFVDHRHIIREFVYDAVVKGDPVEDSAWWGYASWEELKIMDETGVIDVQGHAMTHTWYPINSNIVDYHHPNDNYFWLWWNANREKKPYWLTEYNSSDVEYGTPIFSYGKSLIGKIFLPSPEVSKYCTEYVAKNGGKDFFSKKKRNLWFNELNTQIQTNFGINVGRYETDQEYNDRLINELTTSKKIIEEKIGKKVNFIAWPGGGQNKDAQNIVKESGYLAYTAKGKPYNKIGDSPEMIFRMGGWSGLCINNKPIQFVEKIFLKIQLSRGYGKKNLFTFIVSVGRTSYRFLTKVKNKLRGEKT